MTIWEESQIAAEAGKYQDIVLFGKPSLVNIMCRYFLANQMAVQYVSYADHSPNFYTPCQNRNTI